MTFEENQKYNNAKIDVLKAIESVGKLDNRLKEQLFKELAGEKAFEMAVEFMRNQMRNN